MNIPTIVPALKEEPYVVGYCHRCRSYVFARGEEEIKTDEDRVKANRAKREFFDECWRKAAEHRKEINDLRRRWEQEANRQNRLHPFRKKKISISIYDWAADAWAKQNGLEEILKIARNEFAEVNVDYWWQAEKYVICGRCGNRAYLES